MREPLQRWGCLRSPVDSGAIHSLYLLPGLFRAQDETHPGILRTLPQREGTAHPATQSLKSCSPPTYPTLPPPHSPPLPHPHPLASCSLGTAPRQTQSPVHRPGPALQGVE